MGMAKMQEPTLSELIGNINKRLDSLDDLLSWLIPANARMRHGQRVQFSGKAERAGLTRRIDGKLRCGVVEYVGNGPFVKVRLDGSKHAKSYHHSFFEPTPRRAPRRAKGRAKR